MQSMLPRILFVIKLIRIGVQQNQGALTVWARTSSISLYVRFIAIVRPLNNSLYWYIKAGEPQVRWPCLSTLWRSLKPIFWVSIINGCEFEPLRNKPSFDLSSKSLVFDANWYVGPGPLRFLQQFIEGSIPMFRQMITMKYKPKNSDWTSYNPNNTSRRR